jgi:signal transduction histidine kinase
MRRLRTQLTLLYAVPFLISGAALLSIPVLQIRQTAPVVPGMPPDLPPPVAVERVLVASVVGLAVMVAIAIVLGYLVAGRYLRPLRTITATAREISASNLHRRLGETGRNNEFDVLARTLDDLFARLEGAFDAQRRFVANASHELRTPLTAERALLQVALADPEADLRTTCHQVLELGAAQERLIDALLTLASGEQGVQLHEPVDLADLVRRAAAGHEDAAVTIETALAPAPTTGDPRLLGILVANLVDNAVLHNVPGGSVEITTSAESGDRAWLTVGNTGPVVEVDYLFQPFHRQRARQGGGHGLGLAIARTIADAHGATIDARPRAGGGLDIDVHLP